MKKRILSIFLLLCLVVSIAPFSTAAEQPDSELPEEAAEEDLRGSGSYWTELTLAEATATADAVYDGTAKEDTILVFHSTNCGICRTVIPQYKAYANEQQIRVKAYTYRKGSEKGQDGSTCPSMYKFYTYFTGSVGYPIVVTYNKSTGKTNAMHSVRSLDTFKELLKGFQPNPYDPNNPFLDVEKSDYFYDAVCWAVKAKPQITTGITTTSFRPKMNCTRAQVVTFLWRAKGCPAPTGVSNPFTDLEKDAYYYKAVLWAIEKGIAKGMTDTRFDPNRDCSRGHVVTFLWRAEGSPKVSAVNKFTDVKEDAFYYEAVLWAVSKGITKGMTETGFWPDYICNRGQVVTFLYRLYG